MAANYPNCQKSGNTDTRHDANPVREEGLFPYRGRRRHILIRPPKTDWPGAPVGRPGQLLENSRGTGKSFAALRGAAASGGFTVCRDGCAPGNRRRAACATLPRHGGRFLPGGLDRGFDPASLLFHRGLLLSRFLHNSVGSEDDSALGRGFGFSESFPKVFAQRPDEFGRSRHRPRALQKLRKNSETCSIPGNRGDCFQRIAAKLWPAVARSRPSQQRITETRRP